MIAGQLEDVTTLARSSLFAALAMEDVGVLLARLAVVSVSPAEVLVREGDDAVDMAFVLDGHASVERHAVVVGALKRGDALGVVGFARRGAHTETVTARAPMRVAKLSRAALDALQRERSDIALHFEQALMVRLAEDLATALSLARFEGAAQTMLAGARLPEEHEGALVVAARVGPNALSLDARVSTDAVVTPITTHTGEGREVYRRSAGLALLEAARRVGAPPMRLGPSISSGRIVVVASPPPDLADALERALAELVSERVPFRSEIWDRDRAIEHFEAEGWTGAAALLLAYTASSIELVCCGGVRALGPGPLVRDTGVLQGLRVLPHPQGLLLDFGPRVRTQLAPRPHSTMIMELRAPRYGAAMARSQTEWLDLLGVRSVGDFNQSVVSGRVDELIFVSEGFHEKHIAEIADAIRDRRGVRVVAVAGPSASGKTTFIRRLEIQLVVNGIHPVGLELDQYYRDRDALPRDAHGDVDLETLSALDLELLGGQVTGLLEGEAVRTARYDFATGRSHPAGGPLLSLGAEQVLLVEGIHALDPQLFDDQVGAHIFRIFVHPATSQPFDRLTQLEPSDVRLLRRIVRDRHQRGFAAHDNLARWPSVRRGERLAIFPFQQHADCVFDTSLVYEPSVLRVYAERYLLEVPREHPTFPAAHRLRQLLERFVPIHPDAVPKTSLLREFIGGSGFRY